MKLDEIPCVLSIEERILLIKYLLHNIETQKASYICPQIEEYIFLNQDIYNRTCDVFGFEADHSMGNARFSPIDILLKFGNYMEVIEDKHLGKMSESEGEIYTINDSASYIKLKLCLPELLEYEPEVLDRDSGYWGADDMESRIKVLNEIKEKLNKQLNER